MAAEQGDEVKVTNGEFAGCTGRVVSREDFMATVRISHSNGTLLKWPRIEKIHVGDVQRITP